MAVLVSDSFNRADNASALGTTDSYSGGTAKAWSIISGTVGISGNAAYSSSTAGGLAGVDTGQSDVRATMTIATYGQETDLYFRSTDANNNWRVVAYPNEIFLQKMVSGTRTTLYDSGINNFTGNAGDVISVIAQGSTISLYVNGALITTVTDTFNQTVTKCGIGFWNATTSRIDNFQVESLPSTVLVSDSFNRVDSATSLGTTDSFDGGTAKTWAAYRSTWGISGFQAYCATMTGNAGSAVYYALVDSGQSDVKITTTVPVVNDSYAVAFRVKPTAGGVNDETGLIYHAGNGNLQSFSGNSYTTIAALQPLVAGDTLQIALSGSTITVYRNGINIGTATSTINQTVTTHGLANWRTTVNGTNTANGSWDNFKVESLAAGTTVAGSASGGSVSGGSAISSISQSTSLSANSEGGSITGGSATFTAQTAASATGGSITGGSAAFTAQDAANATGGSTTGGSASSVAKATASTIGGSVTGGTSVVSTNGQVAANSEGGSSTGGSATFTAKAAANAAGGSVTGGTSIGSANGQIVTSAAGGSITGGSAASLAALAVSSLGGSSTGGSSTFTANTAANALGGSATGGTVTGTEGAMVYASASGGSTTGGTAVGTEGIVVYASAVGGSITSGSSASAAKAAADATGGSTTGGQAAFAGHANVGALGGSITAGAVTAQILQTTPSEGGSVSGGTIIISNETIISKVFIQGDMDIVANIAGDMDIVAYIGGDVGVTLTKQDFDVHMGKTRQLQVTVTNKSTGAAVVLSGATITWTAWNSPLDRSEGRQSLLTKQTGSGDVTISNAQFTVSLVPADTANLKVGDYFHRADITDAGGNAYLACTGTLTVHP